MAVESMAKLKQWLWDQDRHIDEMIRSAEKDRRTGWVFGLDDADEEFNRTLDQNIAIMAGKQRAFREAYQKLDEFATHHPTT